MPVVEVELKLPALDEDVVGVTGVQGVRGGDIVE